MLMVILLQTVDVRLTMCWDCKKIKQPTVIGKYNAYRGEGVGWGGGWGRQKWSIDEQTVFWGKQTSIGKISFSFFRHCESEQFNFFYEWRKENPDVEELKRPNCYLQSDFMDVLIRELASIDLCHLVPLATNASVFVRTAHSILLEFTDLKRKCKLCYQTEGVERKKCTKCSACDAYLCFHGNKNHLLKHHQFSWMISAWVC